ncbi:conjugative transposon protein TraM [Elizabethkingia anophelis]|uniref:conjugative transposon protein TraM n=1 Tax=Elizabethkingia anophelis TaxID=1117645 RepID=UPI00248EEB97|nr:conjugative transposon protein TraM [Elizabethkingia anophelis]EJC8060216.1 conjugative transposon protein TraM [Elizabethkingia anophelis]MDV3781413.1 conjugative transposon protein TraM [Elizabethkingia anophelis]MDV3791638.1 conjugative transposon protein TraM [Elizabethkingia anophelis]MDV3810548.1 conjugative transposon protein TraM [Elizabethkingia anophelis]MDV4006421.1 conjugative transposon protein TraM [Elizabethkingia anophelis]
MESSKAKTVNILIHNPDSAKSESLPEIQSKSKMEKLKKPMVFILMGIAFLGCLYLVFKPSSDKSIIEQKGLNEFVPDASGSIIHSDKQKAYEQALFEEKKQEEKNAMKSLSYYWNEEKEQITNQNQITETSSKNKSYDLERSKNTALSTYHNGQNTLSSFYKEDRNYEAENLKKELIMLKKELAEKDSKPVNTMQDQIKLMEKSYEMASRYFPSVKASEVKEKPEIKSSDTLEKTISNKKSGIKPLLPLKKNIVSHLYQTISDTEQPIHQEDYTNQRLFNIGQEERSIQIKNSISACIHKSQRVIYGELVVLRLLEPVEIGGFKIPKGQLLTGPAQFQTNRLQILIQSVVYNGNIIPTDIQVYDLDGQEGLFTTYSPEKNALKEIISNIGTNTGTSISLSSTAGQQIASDMSKSLVQGISGYFSKKVKIPKVMLKTGHKVWLVSKK